MECGGAILSEVGEGEQKQPEGQGGRRLTFVGNGCENIGRLGGRRLGALEDGGRTFRQVAGRDGVRHGQDLLREPWCSLGIGDGAQLRHLLQFAVALQGDLRCLASCVELAQTLVR